MKVSDLFENKTNTIEFTTRYNKIKRKLSKSDPILKKSIQEFETLISKGTNRTDEKENKLKSYNVHYIPFASKGKGATMLVHQKEGFKLYQAHLNSRQKRGQFVAVYGVDLNNAIIRFVTIGSHDDTTGG